MCGCVFMDIGIILQLFKLFFGSIILFSGVYHAFADDRTYGIKKMWFNKMALEIIMKRTNKKTIQKINILYSLTHIILGLGILLLTTVPSDVWITAFVFMVPSIPLIVSYYLVKRLYDNFKREIMK